MSRRSSTGDGKWNSLSVSNRAILFLCRYPPVANLEARASDVLSACKMTEVPAQLDSLISKSTCSER